MSRQINSGGRLSWMEDNNLRKCPKDCPAKGKGALAHVENPDCVWRDYSGEDSQEGEK